MLRASAASDEASAHAGHPGAQVERSAAAADVAEKVFGGTALDNIAGWQPIIRHLVNATSFTAFPTRVPLFHTLEVVFKKLPAADAGMAQGDIDAARLTCSKQAEGAKVASVRKAAAAALAALDAAYPDAAPMEM